MPLRVAALGAAAVHASGEDYCTGKRPEFVPGPRESRDFDDCNDLAFFGAISKVCGTWKDSGNGHDPSKGLLNRFDVYYADVKTYHGEANSPDEDPNNCFSLQPSEYITRVASYGNPNYGITGVSLNTNENRHWMVGYDNSMKVSDETAPEGQHLMATYGNDGGGSRRRNRHAGLRGLGLYWGSGGGYGHWTTLSDCAGCGPLNVTYTSCTTVAGEKSVTKSTAWAVSVTNELKAGFKFKGAGASRSVKVKTSTSQSIVDYTESSFTDYECATYSRSCDKRFLYQWGFSHNFDLEEAFTTTGHFACTDEPNPCCAPTTFTDNPAICDLNPTEVSICPPSPPSPPPSPKPPPSPPPSPKPSPSPPSSCKELDGFQCHDASHCMGDFSYTGDDDLASCAKKCRKQSCACFDHTTAASSGKNAACRLVSDKTKLKDSGDAYVAYVPDSSLVQQTSV